MAQHGTIGMLYEQPTSFAIAAGRLVAVRQMVQALGRYMARHRLALLCPPRQRPAVAVSFAMEKGIAAIDRTHAANVDALGLTAWHEAELDLFTPFAVRERAQRAFPITMVHHTISYKSLLHGAFLRLLLARPQPFDSLICTSVAARDALENMLGHVAERLEAEHGMACAYGGRFDVIPLGTDTERFHPIDKPDARRRFGLDPQAFVMLWLGRLSPIDKADLLPLVQVVAELVAANPQRKLQLVCAGSQRPGEQFGDVIRTYADALGVSDAVRVVTDRDAFEPWLAHLYASADIFVAPTDNVQETFGLTPIEAMAAGVPQVVADWDGYRDTVVEGETGFLIPTVGAPHYRDLDDLAVLSDEPYDHLSLASGVAVDLAALQQALQCLIDDEALRTRMAHASRMRAVETFSWPRIVARYESLWEELAERAKGASGGPVTSGYALPCYGAFFESYPSRLLTDETALWLSERGRRATTGASLDLPLPYNNDFGYLDPDLLRRALLGFKRFADKGQPLAVGRAVGVLLRTDENKDDRRRDYVMRHVLWLLKYGYLKLSNNAP